MKLKNILLLTGILVLSFYKSQIGLDGTQPKQIVPFPTSAQSYSLSKVEAIPMDYFRGKANISIPIYTISVDGVSIPISLSYNTGGIKLNEVATGIGLGWVLNIPGSISQNMQGQDDRLYPFFSKNLSDYGAYHGMFNELPINNEIRANLAMLYDNAYDTKKDIFDYNLPTASGSFILKDNNQVFLIPNDDVVITRNGTKFYVKDTNGVEYWVSPKNAVESMYIGGYSTHISQYNVDSLKVNNKRIQFEYNKDNSYTERNINQVANFKITPNLSQNYEQLVPLPKYEKTESTSGFSEGLISKIKFDQGEVTFLYSDDANSAFPDGSKYRKDLNSLNGPALRRIIVINKAGTKLKDVSFNYSYFETDNPNKTYEDYRLKLNSIHDNLQNNEYDFEYNEESKLPKRSSSNDDYWGYINANHNKETTNIPDNIPLSYGITSTVINSVSKRNREPNETYAILGSLKSIKYPTGAKKNFYYELPYTTEKESSGYAFGNVNIGNIDMDDTGDPIHVEQSFPIKTAHIQQITNIPGATIDKLQLVFNNICDNSDNSGHQNEIEPGDETSCVGTAIYKQYVFSHFNPQQVDWNISGPGSSIELSLYRLGSCRCSLYSTIRYKYPTYTEKTRKYAGLRIRKIEDVDQNNVSNVYEYSYGKYENGTFVPDFKLNQLADFSSVIKRYVRQFDGGSGGGGGSGLGNEGSGDNAQIGATFEEYYRIHNSSQANNSYGSSDNITYPSVIETTGKGKIIREFEDYTSSNYLYNKWNAGRLKRELYLNKNNDTLKVVKNTYKLNTLKNSLSEFTTNTPNIVAFSADFSIIKAIVTVLQTPVDIYNVEHIMYMIESAKVENDTTETMDYLNGKKVTSTTKYTYYDTDINKPINLQNTESTFPSGEKVKTSYQYAHEKNNPLMIAKNMIAIPLETKTTQMIGTTTKTLSRAETIYPISQSEANTKSSGLVLPLSVVSYDNLNASPSTEVKYDKYDEKGNILQYTIKEGIPVAIVWGYNQTQPIAKIEGITYAELLAGNLITNIVSKSDEDAADPTKEGLLLNALNDFRKQSAFVGKQVSTFTYDPLIGVTSITPPSGIREVYVYDTANRLKEVKVREKDAAGNFVFKKVKEYNYNYKQ